MFISPDYNLPLDKQKELVLLSFCVWGEARGEGFLGKLAVANVVINRWKKQKSSWGKTIKDVILKPKQFSFFNKLNRKNLFPKVFHLIEKKNISVWTECCKAAYKIYYKQSIDLTKGATYYLRYDLKPKPKWTKKLRKIIRIGNHVFYKEKK